MNRDELILECFGIENAKPGQEILDHSENGVDVLSHLDLSYKRLIVMTATEAPGVGAVDASVTLTVAAIANVCTDPARRGEGLASGLIRLAHERAATHAPVSFAALFSGYLDFYGRFGYFHPDGGPRDFLVCPLRDGAVWPAGRVRTQGSW